MNILLLQWGLISFVLGIVLSLPLAAVYYQNSPQMGKNIYKSSKAKIGPFRFFHASFSHRICLFIGMGGEIGFPLICSHTLSFWNDMQSAFTPPRSNTSIPFRTYCNCLSVPQSNQPSLITLCLVCHSIVLFTYVLDDFAFSYCSDWTAPDIKLVESLQTILVGQM
ncbi:hypothetical protein [Aneurinibacillus tyrosinisolvens]|uniref:hypothetical protein n=1 Tax=Aneurinibacillus tyrosinisolvens TaxID=1443435 RepID=UPI00063EF9B4|nr:hypothetical protein [Aneurinibacillus tyrosinisolvens]